MRGSKGIIYSTALHGLILFFLLVGLPDFFHRPTEVEPEAISVDILPIAPMSNVKPQEKQLEKVEKKVEEKNVEKKAVQETKKEEPKEADKQAVPLPDKKLPKEEKKKPEKKKPEKKEEDPLKAVLNSVKAQAKAEEGRKPAQQKAPTNAHEAKSQHYDPGAPLSMSEKDAIRQQVEVKWNAPVGAKDAYNLKVLLHLELNQDGTVTKVEFVGDKGRYGSDPFFRAAVDSAIRAVEQASPLKNLPVEKYNVRDGWREIEMNFDPKDALY